MYRLYRRVPKKAKVVLPTRGGSSSHKPSLLTTMISLSAPETQNRATEELHKPSSIVLLLDLLLNGRMWHPHTIKDHVIAMPPYALQDVNDRRPQVSLMRCNARARCPPIHEIQVPLMEPVQLVSKSKCPRPNLMSNHTACGLSWSHEQDSVDDEHRDARVMCYVQLM
jgi:hypothetical protein